MRASLIAHLGQLQDKKNQKYFLILGLGLLMLEQEKLTPLCVNIDETLESRYENSNLLFTIKKMIELVG